jgi:hypothetical protein
MNLSVSIVVGLDILPKCYKKKNDDEAKHKNRNLERDVKRKREIPTYDVGGKTLSEDLIGCVHLKITG